MKQMAKKTKIEFTEKVIDVKKLRTLHEGGRSIDDLAIQYNMTKKEITDMLIQVLYQKENLVKKTESTLKKPVKKAEVTLEQEAETWDTQEPTDYFIDFEDDVDPSAFEDK
jgi:hypothetical protein